MAERFGPAFLLASALLLAPACLQAQAQAPETTSSVPPPAAPDTPHLCLNQKERRAATETGKLVHLAAAMRTARSRVPGTIVQARLCHGAAAAPDSLVYVLTVLAHDGKVARVTVDAVKGTVIGGL